jgi:hypothetical protein
MRHRGGAESLDPGAHEAGTMVASAAGDSFAETESLTYRFSGRDAEGPFVCEQHAYLTEDDGRINWMRLVCSGFCTED